MSSAREGLGPKNFINQVLALKGYLFLNSGYLFRYFYFVIFISRVPNLNLSQSDCLNPRLPHEAAAVTRRRDLAMTDRSHHEKKAARDELAGMTESDALRLVGRTADQSILMAALADGRDELALAVAANETASHDVIARLFAKGSVRAQQAAVRMHLQNREVDLARLVLETEAIDVVADYVSLMARRHPQEMDQASDILSSVNPTLHAMLWNILEAKGLLADPSGRSLSYGAKALFMFAASVPMKDTWLRRAPDVARTLNSAMQRSP
jgi:hypothetical protein